MIKTLFMTEIAGNRGLLAIAFLANLLLFILLAINTEGLNDYVAASTIILYASCIIYAVKASEEKRYRLYMQLPVTSNQISIATWAFIVFLLSISLPFWLLYWLIAEAQPQDYNLYLILGPFLSVLCLIAAFSVAFNLGTYKPGYLQWVFIIVAIASVIIAGNLTNFSDSQNSSVRVFPFILSGYADHGVVNSGLALAQCLLLMAADHYVYTRSDSYLK